MNTSFHKEIIECFHYVSIDIDKIVWYDSKCLPFCQCKVQNGKQLSGILDFNVVKPKEVTKCTSGESSNS